MLGIRFLIIINFFILETTLRIPDLDLATIITLSITLGMLIEKILTSIQNSNKIN